jgi:hypothetical protein
MTAIATKPYPSHIIDVDGRLVNAEVGDKHLDELREYAREEKYDLEAECRSRYGYGSEWLTIEQLGEMLRVIIQRCADRINSTPSHYHYCSDCGAGQLYFDRSCEGKHPQGNIETECRKCRERTNRFFQRRTTF